MNLRVVEAMLLAARVLAGVTGGVGSLTVTYETVQQRLRRLDIPADVEPEDRRIREFERWLRRRRQYVEETDQVEFTAHYDRPGAAQPLVLPGMRHPPPNNMIAGSYGPRDRNLVLSQVLGGGVSPKSPFADLFKSTAVARR